MTVLLVDDDDALRDLVAEFLGDADLLVASYSAAGEAMERFRHERPEVLITDVNLTPDKDGFWLATAARERWPNLPVVYMSGYDLANFEDRVGARDQYLAKPFTGAELIDAVLEVASLD